MKNCVVKVSNLVKIFDKRKIIKNISFDVSENSVVGILGKNGAGKTTLLGMLMGLILPSSGKIEILGKDLKKKKMKFSKKLTFKVLMLIFQKK